jgi:hypothetical protein
MDTRALLSLAKALREQEEGILGLRARIDALQHFVASATKSDELEMLVGLAEAEHRLRELEPNRSRREQIDAVIQLLEHGKDPEGQDA